MLFKKNHFTLYLGTLLLIFQPTAAKLLDEVDSPGINREEKIVFNAYEQRRGGWAALIKKYGASILSGATIGALCGLSCTYIEKSLRLGYSRLIAWFIFSKIRIGIINHLVIDAQRYKAEHSRATIHSSAWIADWLAYLYCYRNQIFDLRT